MPINEVSLRKIVVEGDPQVLVREAEALARKLAGQGKASTSQVRAIFDEVRQIETLWHSQRLEEAWRRMVLLKARMAYRGQRAKGELEKLVREVLIPSLELVTESKDKAWERFPRFVEFLEAILAYYVANVRG